MKNINEFQSNIQVLDEELKQFSFSNLLTPVYREEFPLCEQKISHYDLSAINWRESRRRESAKLARQSQRAVTA